MKKIGLCLILAAILNFSGCCIFSHNSIFPAPLASIEAQRIARESNLKLADGPIDNVKAFTSKENMPVYDGTLEKAVGDKGTVTFWFKADRLFRSTFKPSALDQKFLRLDGLAEFVFHAKDKSDNCPAIYIYWGDLITGINDAAIFLPQIPEDTWLHLAFTWDSNEGLFNIYLNGTPIKSVSNVSPWQINSPAEHYTIFSGILPTAQLKIYDENLDRRQINELVYDKYSGSMDKYLGAVSLGNISDQYISSLKGELFYSNPLDKPADIQNWVKEGPVNIEFKDDWMIMASDMADAGGPTEGHITTWCDKTMPENFIAQWDFQMRSEFGLTISFFCAKGINGEDIFDPSLASRDGTFMDYVKGDINNYHISYQASTGNFQGRATSHLRKNSGFALASNGPIGIPAGSTDVHKITLIKNGPHIQMAVDERIIIDFTEDGNLGEVYGSGKIGFRQMKWTKAAYRNFMVYHIK